MKRKYFLPKMMAMGLVALLQLVICQSAAAQKEYVQQRSDYTFRTQVFSTPDDEGGAVADSIITFVTNKQGTYTLVSYTQPLDPEYWRGFGDIVEDDINFDGIPDLMICLGPTNAFGGFTYDGYAWDKELHTFVKIENFDEIMDPTFIKNDKTIIGTFRVDNEYDISTYKLNKNKAVLINSEHLTRNEIE